MLRIVPSRREAFDEPSPFGAAAVEGEEVEGGSSAGAAAEQAQKVEGPRASTSLRQVWICRTTELPQSLHWGCAIPV